jgi:hypothetical protein
MDSHHRFVGSSACSQARDAMGEHRLHVDEAIHVLFWENCTPNLAVASTALTNALEFNTFDLSR